MNESKKLNSQFKSIFWYIIYTLPIIILFITFISYSLCFNESGNLEILNMNLFDLTLESVNSSFSGFIWSIISDSLTSIFNLLNLSIESNISGFILIMFAWFIQFSIIHIIIDILLIIPNMYHLVVERWSKKNV